MVHRRSHSQVEAIRGACKLVSASLRIIGRLVKPGVTTKALDDAFAAFIRQKKADALFLGYRGYPAHICASVNEEVVHGIPGPRALEEGDIVGVDVGIRLNGWCGDAARTFPVGQTEPKVNRLLEIARGSLDAAIAQVKPGNKLVEVCRAVQNHAESHGYKVVRKYAGHGIGRKMHEDPHIPNFVSEDEPPADVTLEPGMILAIEPMVNQGSAGTLVLEDGWTVVTEDGSLSAHFEHTVAVTDDGADVLTK